MITIITPTGDRLEAFKLCIQWMENQYLPYDQWIIVDDGHEPIPKEWLAGNDRIDYIRRSPMPGELHTLTLNMEIAVHFVRGDKIFIIEDDDYYGPKYLETYSRHLDDYDIVGEMGARYYNLPMMKFRRIGNGAHASLCQTAFRRAALQKFCDCIPGDPYIDARFWRSANGFSKYLINDTQDVIRLHCGMKGLLGRKGIGTGHDPNASYYIPDWNIDMLVKWVGEYNAKTYMDMIGQSFESVRTMRKPAVMKPKKPTFQEHHPDRSAITVITCTGDRHEAFDLLTYWMSKQTHKPDQWLVVDDGVNPLASKGDFEYVRRDPGGPYKHTLCLNILEALNRVRNGKIVFMEDDDWYSPKYIEYMSKYLDKADLVGINKALFYNPVKRIYMLKQPVKQPALFQTACRKSVLPIIHKICADMAPKERQLRDIGLVDVFLWRERLERITEDIPTVVVTESLRVGSGNMLLPGTKIKYPNIPESLYLRAMKNRGCKLVIEKISRVGNKMALTLEPHLAIGVKGMPGRKGLTSAQNSANSRYQHDPQGSFLKSIIGNDFQHYERFYEGGGK